MDRTDTVSSDILPVVNEEDNESMEYAGDMMDCNASVSTTRDYAFTESGEGNTSSRFKRKRSLLNSKQFQNFRFASLSVSMLAKPSDDRKAHAVLAGWNVSNLIQGTGILGVPYAAQPPCWTA